jgi:hypothetical protein
MVQQYVVSLKNQKYRIVNLIGIVLSLISVLFFLNLFITRPNHSSIALPIGAAFIIGVLAYNIWQSSKGNKVYYSRALLIAALVWMKMPFMQWLFFLFIVLALLEYQLKYSLEIGFSDNGVVINSLLKKRYAWNQFNNIVLKDGWITLDFVNNKVMQQEVVDDEEDEADEDEFNLYCQQQLKKAGQVPVE